VPNKTSKVISMKGKKQVGALASAERGTLVTAEICFNELGNYIPPLLVFPRKNYNPLFEVGAPPETAIACHPSGWMQSEIFAPTWFNHFLRHAKPTAEDPVLLILDGHATHTKNIALIEMARENHVHILVIPPHTSHRLQPLDVSFMGLLNTYYEQEVRVWLRNHPGKVITIYQVASLFGAAYQKAATSSTAINGFAKTGICPFNPNIFPDYLFAPAETTDRQTRANCSSSNCRRTSSSSSNCHRAASSSSNCRQTSSSSCNCRRTSAFNFCSWLTVVVYTRFQDELSGLCISIRYNESPSGEPDASWAKTRHQKREDGDIDKQSLFKRTAI